MKSSYIQTAVFALLILLAGCAKEKRQDQLTVDELSEKAFTCLTDQDYSGAITHLEEIIARFPEHQNLARYKILLAEAYFKTKSYPAAQAVYENFNEFYPSDKRAEYAKYKSLLSMFHQTLRSDCDQTKTHETIQLCQEYLQNPTFNRYRKDVMDKQAICETKLLDKELYVFNFYLKHGNYDAARNRLKYVKEKYLARNADLEARILFHECKLAQKEKNLTLVQKNLDRLHDAYPTSNFTQMAQGLVTHRPFLF